MCYHSVSHLLQGNGQPLCFFIPHRRENCRSHLAGTQSDAGSVRVLAIKLCKLVTHKLAVWRDVAYARRKYGTQRGSQLKRSVGQVSKNLTIVWYVTPINFQHTYLLDNIRSSILHKYSVTVAESPLQNFPRDKRQVRNLKHKSTRDSIP